MSTQWPRNISVEQLKAEIDDATAEFTLLDVREPWELRLAGLKDRRLVEIPMSQLPSQAKEQLPDLTQEHPPIFVLCHHGVRSGTVARWLVNQGWKNVYNVHGGLEAYRLAADPSINKY